jgi:hypothetical protein
MAITLRQITVGVSRCLIVLWAAIPITASAADNQLLRRFGSGTGPDAVGMIDASEDTEVAGPQAIYAGEGNDVYLLDQVNGRVLSFDPKRPDGQTRSFELPTDLQPTDLVVKKGEIFVWDGDVHALKPTGAEDAPVRGLEEFQSRGVNDEFTISAFAQMGSQKPGSEAELLDENTRSLSSKPQPRGPAKQYVNSRARGPVVATVSLDRDNAGAELVIQTQGEVVTIATLKLKVRDRLGATEFLEIDRKGRMFVLAEDIPTSGAPSSAFVARYSPTGALEGIFELPLSQSVALSRRFVTVSQDGDVYFLRTQQASVDVLGVGFRPLRQKVIDVRPSQGALNVWQQKNGKGPIAAVAPLTRQRVIETAFAFERYRWRLAPNNYGRDPDMACTGFHRIRRPGYLHGKLGQEVQGVPYCWGCFGNLWQLNAKLQRGMLAGNVCTRNEPRNDVVGVDCSAFVSAAWGLSSHFTTTAIPAIVRRLENPWDLLPGDALNKPGSHVMLFLRFTADRKAEVIEATPGACNGRVCRNIYPLASMLARGYAPVRFRALASEAVAKVSFPDQQTEGVQKPSKHQSRTNGRRR